MNSSKSDYTYKRSIICPVEHKDHLALIEKAVSGVGVWADLGSGRGAFTLALADLLEPGSRIFSLDRDRSALAEQAQRVGARHPHLQVEFLSQDFGRTLELPPLDGILMANSLHFVRRKEPLLNRLLGHLKVSGRFVLVEYNTDRGNLWVPHPLSYPAWEELSQRVGLSETRKIGAYPSRFLREIYAAESRRA